MDEDSDEYTDDEEYEEEYDAEELIVCLKFAMFLTNRGLHPKTVNYLTRSNLPAKEEIWRILSLPN